MQEKPQAIMFIQCLKRIHAGKTMYYPTCQKGRWLLVFLGKGRKCFTETQIGLLSLMGIEVAVS